MKIIHIKCPSSHVKVVVATTKFIVDQALCILFYKKVSK